MSSSKVQIQLQENQMTAVERSDLFKQKQQTSTAAAATSSTTTTSTTATASNKNIAIPTLFWKIKPDWHTIKKHNQNPVQLTMKQGRKLVYVATKKMLRNNGDVLQRGGQMTMRAWEEVARELNSVLDNLRRPAKIWARCYVSKKHFISCKFKAYIEQQTNMYGKNLKIEWSNFTHFDLLLLQKYRLSGYPDMPDVHKLLHDIDKYKLLDAVGQLRYPKEGEGNYKFYSKFMPNNKSVDSKAATDNCSEPSQQLCESHLKNSIQADMKFPMKPPIWARASQSPHMTYLAYLAGKHLMQVYGLRVTKHCRIALETWKEIAQQMQDVMGVIKTAQKWRKTYSANKYVMHSRFLRHIQEQGNSNQSLDWTKVRMEELLHIQDLRTEGFSNMPSADIVLKAYERNQEYLTAEDCENSATDLMHLQQQQEQQTTTTHLWENNGHCPENKHDTFSMDYNRWHREQLQNNHWQPMTGQTVYETERLEIKAENYSTFSIAEINEEEQTAEAKIFVKKEQETDNDGDDDDESEMLPTTFAEPVLLEQSEHTSTTTQSSTRNILKPSSKLTHPLPTNVSSSTFEATTQESQEQYYLDRRLLEINEKMLRAKNRKNKLLKKRNQILETHTQLFGQLLTKLDALIEKKNP